MSPRSIGLSLAAALVLAVLGTSGWRVSQLERAELEYESPPRSLAQLAGAAGSTQVSARIGEVTLRNGEDAVFELCTNDQLEVARWLDAVELAVFRLPELELMRRVQLDRATLARAKRGKDGACLRLAGGHIEHAGKYTIDAVWPKRAPAPDLMQVSLRARVLARPQLTGRDRAYVIVLGAAILLALGSAIGLRGAPNAADGAADTSVPIHAGLRTLPAAVAIAALVLAAQLPSPGSTMTFVKGVGLAAIQIVSAWWFARVLTDASPRSTLALEPPPRAAAWTVAAVLAAGFLYATAELALRFTPSTGEAPIQTFVSWPSGMLCFGVLGALLPLAEELFFRGYLYRAALVFGRAAAFGLTLLLFVGMHAEQSWGNWGGLVSIAVAGVVLTALRATSGSALIPAIAHVLYNFALSMASF